MHLSTFCDAACNLRCLHKNSFLGQRQWQARGVDDVEDAVGRGSLDEPVQLIGDKGVLHHRLAIQIARVKYEIHFGFSKKSDAASHLS